MVDFDIYYKEYLGCRTFEDGYVDSVYRDKPINVSYYYPFIRSLYKSNIITSVSSRIYHKEYAHLLENDISELSLFELNKIYSCVQRKAFYRYSFNKDYVDNCGSAQVLKYEHKDFFMCSGKNLNKDFKENKWLKLIKYIEEQNIFILVYDNKIVSTCKISDIYCGGANLYVHTDELYRNKGFGKNVVSLAIIKCLERGLLPIYFAEKNNVNSQKLATSLGFNLEAEECCFCVMK